MKDAQDTIAKKVQKLTQKLNKTLGFLEKRTLVTMKQYHKSEDQEKIDKIKKDLGVI